MQKEEGNKFWSAAFTRGCTSRILARDVDRTCQFLDLDGPQQSKATLPTNHSFDMASAGCWKCVTRSTPAQLIHNVTLRMPAATAAFSTTPAALKGGPVKKKTNAAGMAHAKAAKAAREKGGKSLKIKKKAPPKPTGKPPAPGERKAFRKRIILSNSNALEVEGLQDIDEKVLVDEGMVGKVVGLPNEVVDQLRASEAFKITQGWGLFRRPAVLLRKESVMCSKMLEEAGKEKVTKRLVVDGDRVTGKSMVLLHAMATAFVKGWVVLTIPEGMSFALLVQSEPD
jgi:small subunit ribosomal protein S29